MKVGIFNKADGVLASSYEAEAPIQENYGGPWGDKAQFAHLEIAAGVDSRAATLSITPATETDPEVIAVVEDADLKAELAASDLVQMTEVLVEKAQQFGQKLLKEFAGENIRLGITTDGQTGAVLTKMGGVMTALQSGSLYEAITRAKAIPSGDYDAKYVTEARLIAFINKIENYLGVTPLTTDIP